MATSFELNNPFRTPEWRADRAMALSGSAPRLRPARSDDIYVREYAKFLNRYMHAGESLTPAQQQELYARNASLYYAQMMHFHNDFEWRAMLQARLLTRESYKEIAKRFGTVPEAIEWYAAIFFDVKDRLDCHDWIVKSVMGTAMDRAANREGTMTDHQRNLTYKLFGYYGGPLVLDVIISGFTRDPFPTQSSEIPRWLDSTIKNLLRSRAATAARVFEVNRFNVMQLFELELAIISSDIQAKSLETGVQSPIAKGVEMLLKQAPWALMQDKEANVTPEQIEFSTSAVEPSWGEEYALAQGKKPQSLLTRVAEQELAVAETSNE